MAKEEKKLNYNEELRALKAGGPERLYLLWGPEDYLRELFVAELKKICLPEGEDDFSYKRMDGPDIDPQSLQEAIDSVPFMTEHSLVELRGVELNKLSQADRVWKVLSDIPEYCTVCFVQSSQYEPDGRLKITKNLRSNAKELKFTKQTQSQLSSWVVKRFAAADKLIEPEAVQRLLFISGDIMSRLIPEIDKISAFCKGERVTVKDVEAVANHIPEAIVFDMTEHIAKRDFNSAAKVLAELLADKNNEPIAILALIGQQMRRLYAARIAIDDKLGNAWLMEACSIKFDFIASKLLSAARGFTLPQLQYALELCAVTDYRMKGGDGNNTDSAELIKETVMRIAAGGADA